MCAKKARSRTTPSFICELPLRVNPKEERELLIRLDGGRQIYNACLGESLRRLARLRESSAYQEARQLPKGLKGSPAARRRTKAFAEANAAYGFREYDLHAYAVQFGHAWVGERLDANTIQKIATRAFRAVQQHALGKQGRPRFKGKGQFDSLEGKTNQSGIRWEGEGKTVVWGTLKLQAIVDPRDQVIQHGLACRTKFVRLVRRKLGPHNRFYAQLVCEGDPYQKPQHTLGQGVVGLDLGPSTIAIVTRDAATAILVPFCAELESRQGEIRRLQRKLDRQRRAGDPGNYNPDGTVKAGKKAWHCSHRYLQTREQLGELFRRQVARRKGLQNRLVNRVLALGDEIHLEKLSYRAFQRSFGRSVGFRAPGTFVQSLRRKAGHAGAQVDEFDPRTTCLSQVCVCGAKVKKPLSQRTHVCRCGVGPVQRDLFSAWLACYVESDRLDAGRAEAAWPGVDTRLRAASSNVQPAMGQDPCRNRLLDGRSRSPAQSGLAIREACHGAPSPVTRERIPQPEPPAFLRGE